MEPAGAPASPRLVVDDREVASTIALSTATRQRLVVDVARPSSAPMLFGAPLAGLTVTLALSSVPDDDPAKYDIALVAACAREQSVELRLGDGVRREPDGESQPSWHTLTVDGCALGDGAEALVMKGQANISKLDAQHVELSLPLVLERAGERHTIAIDRLDVAFATR
jgi:hypothetical protein